MKITESVQTKKAGMMDKQNEGAAGSALTPGNETMNIDDRMPRGGMLYALCRRKVIYEEATPEIIAEVMNDQELLELHIFNGQEEYRYLKLRDHDLKMTIRDDAWTIWHGDARETVQKENAYDDTYKEVVCTERGSCAAAAETGEKITVVNYIKYDENDMLHIVNYRYSTAVDKDGEGGTCA